MSADPQHDTPDHEADADQQGELPKGSSTAAWETWNDWSMASAMRFAREQAREHADQEALARFDRYPQWTQGPDPLEALAANRELVDRLTGWRWLATREAREQGRGWEEIGRRLGQSAEQARAVYLDTVRGQRRLAERYPKLGFEPRWLELAEPNQADRAELERRALAYDDPGCPPDTGGRQSGHER